MPDAADPGRLAVQPPSQKAGSGRAEENASLGVAAENAASPTPVATTTLPLSPPGVLAAPATTTDTPTATWTATTAPISLAEAVVAAIVDRILPSAPTAMLTPSSTATATARATPLPTASPIPTVDLTAYASPSVEAINVRADPGESYSILSQLLSGEQAAIIGRNQTDESGWTPG